MGQGLPQAALRAPCSRLMVTAARLASLPRTSQWDGSETARGSCAVGRLGGAAGAASGPGGKVVAWGSRSPQASGQCPPRPGQAAVGAGSSWPGLSLPAASRFLPSSWGPGPASRRHPHLHRWTPGRLGAGRHTSGPAGRGGCSPGPGAAPFWCPGTSARGAAAPCRAGRGRCRATAAASPAPRCTCGHRALSLDPPGPAACAHGPATRCQEGLHTQALAEVLLCPFCGGAC